MENFYEKIAQLLEVNNVFDDEELESFESWDSLTTLSIIAMIDSDYDVRLTAEKLRAFKTVGQLKNFVTESNK